MITKVFLMVLVLAIGAISDNTSSPHATSSGNEPTSREDSGNPSESTSNAPPENLHSFRVESPTLFEDAHAFSANNKPTSTDSRVSTHTAFFSPALEMPAQNIKLSTGEVLPHLWAYYKSAQAHDNEVAKAEREGVNTRDVAEVDVLEVAIDAHARANVDGRSDSSDSTSASTPIHTASSSSSSLSLCSRLEEVLAAATQEHNARHSTTHSDGVGVEAARVTTSAPASASSSTSSSASASASASASTSTSTSASSASTSAAGAHPLTSLKKALAPLLHEYFRFSYINRESPFSGQYTGFSGLKLFSWHVLQHLHVPSVAVQRVVDDTDAEMCVLRVDTVVSRRHHDHTPSSTTATTTTTTTTSTSTAPVISATLWLQLHVIDGRFAAADLYDGETRVHVAGEAGTRAVSGNDDSSTHSNSNSNSNTNTNTNTPATHCPSAPSLAAATRTPAEHYAAALGTVLRTDGADREEVNALCTEHTLVSIIGKEWMREFRKKSEREFVKGLFQGSEKTDSGKITFLGKNALSQADRFLKWAGAPAGSAASRISLKPAASTSTTTTITATATATVEAGAARARLAAAMARLPLDSPVLSRVLIGDDAAAVLPLPYTGHYCQVHTTHGTAPTPTHTPTHAQADVDADAENIGSSSSVSSSSSASSSSSTSTPSAIAPRSPLALSGLCAHIPHTHAARHLPLWTVESLSVDYEYDSTGRLVQGGGSGVSRRNEALEKAFMRDWLVHFSLEWAEDGTLRSLVLLPVERAGSRLKDGKVSNPDDNSDGTNDSNGSDSASDGGNGDEKKKEEVEQSSSHHTIAPQAEDATSHPIDLADAAHYTALQHVKAKMRQGGLNGIPFLSQDAYRIDPKRQTRHIQQLQAHGQTHVATPLGPLDVGILKSELEKQVFVGSVWMAYLEDYTLIGDYERVRSGLDQENPLPFKAVVADEVAPWTQRVSC